MQLSIEDLLDIVEFHLDFFPGAGQAEWDAAKVRMMQALRDYIEESYYD